jgi:aminoglycoside/choline kinase family phosphotransferase
MRLLDLPESRQQLSMLNKVRTALGNVQISAPKNRKDDVATAIALLAHIGQQMLPQIKEVPKEMTVYEQIMAKHGQKMKGDRWDF